jgi:carnosine N-methyltransferase
MKSKKQLITNLNPEILSKNPEEFKRFLVALKAMENYTSHNRWQIDLLNNDYENLGEKYLSKMKYDYKERVKRVENAMDENQIFLSQISKEYKPDPSYLKQYNETEINDLAYNDSGTLNYAVFQYISRDWTSNRKEEREIHYNPIIEAVKKYVPAKSRILLPGAALLRLGYELAKLEYNIDANDYNFMNVILSDYFFNYSKKNQFTFQPLIRSFSNFLTEDAVFRKFSFPDEDINLEGKGKMSLLCGDFTTMYNDKPNTYDCVITCFFMDTAKNIFEYIDVIYNVLKKGGIWINFGPLSYHWVGYENIPTIELPYDKLKEVIINYGFEYIQEETNKTVIYCEIEEFMKNDYFKCIFFITRKK